MPELADWYQLRIELDEPVARAVRLVLDAIAIAPWTPHARWMSPVVASDPDYRTDSLADTARAGELKSDVQLKLVDGTSILFVAGDGKTGVTLTVFETARGVARRWITAMRDVLVHLLDAKALLWTAVVRRRGIGVPVPGLPILGDTTYVVAAADDALAEAFDEPSRVIAAGGWTVQQHGDCKLLTRARDAEDNLELLAAIQDGQWAMARLARPKTCTYSLDPPESDEEPIFRAGAPRLRAVGYDAAAQTAIYSCALADDEHVQPWEIWDLGTALRDGRLPPGEPVRAIRVIFSDRASAERERRPLLDLGITVQCYGEAGELETVEEN